MAALPVVSTQLSADKLDSKRDMGSLMTAVLYKTISLSINPLVFTLKALCSRETARCVAKTVNCYKKTNRSYRFFPSDVSNPPHKIPGSIL